MSSGLDSLFALLLIAAFGALRMTVVGFSAVKDQERQRGNSCQDDDCYCVGTEPDCE